MNKILQICQKNNIPVAATFQYENSGENGAGYCTSVIKGTRASPEMLNLMNSIKPRLGSIMGISIIKDADGETTVSTKQYD